MLSVREIEGRLISSLVWKNLTSFIIKEPCVLLAVAVVSWAVVWYGLSLVFVVIENKGRGRYYLCHAGGDITVVVTHTHTHTSSSRGHYVGFTKFSRSSSPTTVWVEPAIAVHSQSVHVSISSCFQLVSQLPLLCHCKPTMSTYLWHCIITLLCSTPHPCSLSLALYYEVVLIHDYMYWHHWQS